MNCSVGLSAAATFRLRRRESKLCGLTVFRRRRRRRPHEFNTKNPAGLAGARSPVAVAGEQINDPLPRPQPGADHGAASRWLGLEFPPADDTNLLSHARSYPLSGWSEPTSPCRGGVVSHFKRLWRGPERALASCSRVLWPEQVDELSIWPRTSMRPWCGSCPA